MNRTHGRRDFFVVHEGVYEEARELRCRAATDIEELRKFRFSRIATFGKAVDVKILEQVAKQMTIGRGAETSPIPAGFTYLGQFVDHDLTLDKTRSKLGSAITLDELIQGRSPALDLDSLYGLGPTRQPELYQDGVRLKVGATRGSDLPENDAIACRSLEGFDLPRVGAGLPADRRRAIIPDPRNDENLAVAQIHLSFMHLHNRILDQTLAKRPMAEAFELTRAEVVKHYQRMLCDDYLPRVCEPEVVTNVFERGRRVFETPPAGSAATLDSYHALEPAIGYGTMPLEFSVAAFRLGHSMVRRTYEWNRIFSTQGATRTPASPELLMRFSGTSGTLSPPDVPDGSFDALPTNWIPDWRRLFEFSKEVEVNRAEKIDTSLTPFLATLPEGAFGGFDSGAVGKDLQQHLAFRNLVRANMVQLASAQQLHAFFVERQVPGYPHDMLDAGEILGSGTGVSLKDVLSDAEQRTFCANTPLWFYILREAEVRAGGDRLGAMGSRLVAETFHRAIEVSRHSILRDVRWRPWLGDGSQVHMTDLLRYALGDAGLNPLG